MMGSLTSFCGGLAKHFKPLLGGSWVAISGVTSPLTWDITVITIVLL